jgi:hypothetical protein
LVTNGTILGVVVGAYVAVGIGVLVIPLAGAIFAAVLVGIYDGESVGVNEAAV